MSDTYIPASPGVTALAVRLADASAPADIESHPVIAWRIDDTGHVLPVTILGKHFSCDGVEYGPLDGCRFISITGEVHADLDKYIEARREALLEAAQREVNLAAQRAAGDAVTALQRQGLEGAKAAIAVLERFRPAGWTKPYVQVVDVPVSRLGELVAAVDRELENVASEVA